MAAAIGCTVLFGLGWGLFDCNNMPILCQIAQPRYRATGYGIMNLVGIAVGGGVTVFMGRMRDQGLPFSLAFMFSAVVALISAGLLLFISTPLQRRKLTAAAVLRLSIPKGQRCLLRRMIVADLHGNRC